MDLFPGVILRAEWVRTKITSEDKKPNLLNTARQIQNWRMETRSITLKPRLMAHY